MAPLIKRARGVDDAVAVRVRVFVADGCVCLWGQKRAGCVACWLSFYRVLEVVSTPTPALPSPSGDNEILTDLLLLLLRVCVCMIRGVSINAAKSGLRSTLLPSDAIGVSSMKPRKCCDLDEIRTSC
jgi:hypothetical protein